MKILYVALKYDYGDPKRGLGFEHYNFYDSLLRMNGNSNEVIYFPFDEITREVGCDKMNEQLLETVYQEKPNFCFFFLYGDKIKKETIKQITDSKNTITLNWFADDHWRFDNSSKYWARCFNWVTTTDSKAPEKYYKIGYKNVIKTQWACNQFSYKPQNLEKIYDVSFVGQPHGNRKRVIGRIKKAGINVKCWGKSWPAGRVSQEQMLRIFSQSKINLNLTKGSNVAVLKSIAKIFLTRKNNKSIKIENPKYWINNLKSLWGRRREQIKGRNFEILGCNGFLLTGDADNLRDFYEDGKEIVIYKDFKDFVEKIGYYLKHDEEREAIANAGYKRTIKDHTYEKRFNELFKIIGFNSA